MAAVTSVLTNIFHLVISFVIYLPQILLPLPAMMQEATFFEDWSAEQEYTHEYSVVLEKDEDEDFVVLNLADIQVSDGDTFFTDYDYAKKMIRKLVDEQDPDLITLSGDNAWDTIAYLTLVDFIDSLGIPWAPVMGNHDGQGCMNEFWCAYLFYKAENCVWKFGPKDMGYGNYVINIKQGDEIVHTIFMMDTHDNVDYTDANGNHIAGYDHLWENQFAWYEWAVNGIAAVEGKTVESTIFMHIPVYETKEVWYYYYEGQHCAACDKNFTPAQLKDGNCPDCAGVITNAANDESRWIGEYADKAEGVIHETPCPGAVNNHFTDLMLKLGSTKNVIFGHDHVCNASINYEGIQLTYGLKLGYGCYYEKGMMGGTTLTIASDGSAQYEHHFLG